MQLFVLVFCASICIPIAASAETTDEAGAAYPSPFSRPPSLGENYNSWKDAKGRDIGEASLDHSRLPSRVDNSIRPEFPGIYKQKWGTCGQFTAIASIFTYEMNVLNGVHANKAENRYPAHFSWNMINGAKNVGSEAYHGWEVAKHIGIPSTKTYGGVRLDKIGKWPNGYHIWHDAMKHRVTGYRYSPAQTIKQLNEAKGWLYDRNQTSKNGTQIGGLLALDGRMGELKKVTVTIPRGHYRSGEDIWTKWGPSGYGHGITCVGYDDEIGYDLNRDGKITNNIDINNDGKVTLADWEKGAYIVANSWGKEWSGNGRVYLLYSAMIDPTWERGNYLGRIEVHNHQPRVTLKLKLSSSNRSKLRMQIGVAENLEAETPEHKFEPQAFNGWPIFGKSNSGDIPLAGPDETTPLEVGIDLTQLLSELNFSKIKPAKFFLQLNQSDNSKSEGEVISCSILQYDSSGKIVNEHSVKISKGKFDHKSIQLVSEFQLLPLAP